MSINTLSEAVAVIEFLRNRQGLDLEAAIKEAGIPLHLQEHVRTYYSPPLEIRSPDLVSDTSSRLEKCNPDENASWRYFGAYQRFLIDGGGRNKSIVDTLAATSLDLLKHLPKPDAAPMFQTRGLVVGYIQSGKTANMAALIARAADQGYKLFIVLGGFWKDLRAQTQSRLDKEIAGNSDDPAEAPYVIYDTDIPKWVRLTRSGLAGDFTPGPNDLNPQTPKLAVVKKNKKIEDLVRWLEKSPVPLEQLPAIIIDDESDQGSINTNYSRKDDDGDDIDPSATNRRIRELLKLLPKCVYIGFTATPFANVLIDASVDEDLYPRDFIATLPEPPGYFGARKLFGLGLPPSDLSPVPVERPPLDVIRYVNEEDLMDLERVTDSGGDCPRILSDALLSFILSCCGRLSRGHDQAHFSMLVHPSHLTASHEIFAKSIRDELELIKGAATRPAKFPDFMARAKESWENFRHVTREQNDSSLADYDFETVWKFARGIVESIEVKVLNMASADALQYVGTPKRYVVIGGNRLSRGLTLEGLSVSLFTRNANQYDTLLQMGRWFGYRPGYHDLTRIYVEQTLADRFAELARIEDELRSDLQKYAKQPNPPTPLELKPIIRSHPTMAVTSSLKMGAGRPVYISFENTKSETVVFPIENKALLRKNVDAARAFVTQIGKEVQVQNDDGTYTWADVPAESIIEFLKGYEFSSEAKDVNGKNLVGYITGQGERGELSSWDVVLPQGNRTRDPHRWDGDIFTHKILRTPMTTRSIKVLSDPNDIAKWRKRTGRDSKDSTRGCLMVYVIDRKSDEESEIKFFANSTDTEDLIGLVMIFPESKSHATIEYISQ